MHLIKRSAMLALLLCCVAPRFASALEIIYPADKTTITRTDFLILKGGNAPALEVLTVEVNGEKSEPIEIGAPEYKAAFADFLILEPTWEKGKNTVVIKGAAGGKEVAAAKADFYYLANDPAATAPPGYKPFILHTPEKEALCAPCHPMQPSAAQLKGATSENPCASCHKRMFNDKFVHGPEGVFQCIDCHDGKSRPNRWQVSRDELRLCGECHTDKIEELRKNAFVHGPVATGNCTICHNPHASNQPAQLTAAVNDLCLGCHVSIAGSAHVTRGVGGKSHPLSNVPDPLRPGVKLSCTSCHNPHGGAAPAFFRQGLTNRFALCALCHKK